MAHISMYHIALDLAIYRDIKHSLTDVASDPHVSTVTQHVTGDTRTASDIK